jgi:tetratricopeptide (TPR) repeat protein
MNTKHSITVLVLLLGHWLIGSSPIFAQSSSVTELVKEGIALHDAGNYEKAIEKYNEALAKDPNSTVANYEIAYSYYALKDYDNAKKYCLLAMKEYSTEYLSAALIYGSILDDTGNPDEAIKYYKNLLKKYPKEYLLHYNIAISYSKIPRPSMSQKHFEQAIINNLGHGSSHLAFGELMYAKKRRVESVLPLYFFLVVEPDSKRSSQALDLIFEQLSISANKKEGDSIKINLFKSEAYDLQFSREYALISMNAVLKEGESEFKWFSTITLSLFSSLADNYVMKPGIWRDVYVPIFADLINSDHFVAYCHYICQSRYPDSKEWVVEHPYMVDDMFKFINN